MPDVMVDLETLGQRPGCVILSIGAVAFDPVAGRFGQQFHTIINRDDCIAHGLVEDLETLAWWKRQSPEARAVLRRALESPVGLIPALEAFAAFVKAQAGKVCMWGNGADFDNAILAHTYNLVGIKQPWMFWNSRCFRTLKNLRPEITVPRTGLHHDALADAQHQAEHAVALFAGMRTGAQAANGRAVSDSAPEGEAA